MLIAHRIWVIFLHKFLYFWKLRNFKLVSLEHLWKFLKKNSALNFSIWKVQTQNENFRKTFKCRTFIIFFLNPELVDNFNIFLTLTSINLKKRMRYLIMFQIRVFICTMKPTLFSYIFFCLFLFFYVRVVYAKIRCFCHEMCKSVTHRKLFRVLTSWKLHNWRQRGECA